jgi:hypothetical protein
MVSSMPAGVKGLRTASAGALWLGNTPILPQNKLAEVTEEIRDVCSTLSGMSHLTFDPVGFEQGHGLRP